MPAIDTAFGPGGGTGAVAGVCAPTLEEKLTNMSADIAPSMVCFIMVESELDVPANPADYGRMIPTSPSICIFVPKAKEYRCISSRIFLATAGDANSGTPLGFPADAF